MAWPNGTRYKTYAPGSSFPPADPNAIQDQVLQVAGYRGVTPITATESRANVAYGLLGTPDQVTGIVLPTDGLIAVAYQATWQSSVGAAGKAAIFIGANQVKLAQTNVAAPATSLSEATSNNSINTDIPLSTAWWGLSGGGGVYSTAYTGDVTTGQVQGDWGANGGGICYIFAAAGTYTISVQFKASSGSVTVKNRRLWVWTNGFS
jgi:hypothetical protein